MEKKKRKKRAQSSLNQTKFILALYEFFHNKYTFASGRANEREQILANLKRQQAHHSVIRNIQRKPNQILSSTKKIVEAKHPKI